MGRTTNGCFPVPHVHLSRKLSKWPGKLDILQMQGPSGEHSGRGKGDPKTKTRVAWTVSFRLAKATSHQRTIVPKSKILNPNRVMFLLLNYLLFLSDKLQPRKFLTVVQVRWWEEWLTWLWVFCTNYGEPEKWIGHGERPSNFFLDAVFPQVYDFGKEHGLNWLHPQDGLSTTNIIFFL